MESEVSASRERLATATCENDDDAADKELERLENVTMTLALLSTTKVGVTLHAFVKHKAKAHQRANALLQRWKALAPKKRPSDPPVEERTPKKVKVVASGSASVIHS